MTEKVINIEVTMEELTALGNLLHGRSSIRFDPNDPWTAEKTLELRAYIDGEIVFHTLTK